MFDTLAFWPWQTLRRNFRFPSTTLYDDRTTFFFLVKENVPPNAQHFPQDYYLRGPPGSPGLRDQVLENPFGLYSQPTSPPFCDFTDPFPSPPLTSSAED